MVGSDGDGMITAAARLKVAIAADNFGAVLTLFIAVGALDVDVASIPVAVSCIFEAVADVLAVVVVVAVAAVG